MSASLALVETAPTTISIVARNQELLEFRDAALHFAFRFCGNTADAEDLLQTAYLRAVAAPEPLISGKALRNWFFQITANAARDLIRAENRRRSRERDVAMEYNQQAIAPGDSAEAAELRQRVEIELARLDEKYRVPISLHHEHGLSYEEASHVLGTSAGTLRVYVSQGIKELRERLDVPERRVSAEALVALLAVGATMKASTALAASVETIVAGKAVAPVVAAGAKSFAVIATSSGKGTLWMALGVAAMFGLGMVSLYGLWSWSYAATQPPALTPPTARAERDSIEAPKEIAEQPTAPVPPTVPVPPIVAPVVIDQAPALPVLAPPAVEAPPKNFGRNDPALDAKWANATELLGLVKPNFSVSGNWMYDGRSLTCMPGSFVRTAIPYKAPDEYDFRIDFTRTSGSSDVNIIFPAGGESCIFKMDSWSSCYFGVRDGNPDVVPRPALANGVPHTAIVEVRRNKLSATIDGELIKSIELDKSSHLCSSDYRLPDASMLGLGSWRSGITFHRVAIRAVTGTGAPIQADVDAGHAVSDTYWNDAIDLMPAGLSPGNARAGKWQVTAAGLSTDAVRHSRYQLDYAPPEEYDFRVEFTRLDGKSDIGQILAAGGTQFMWKMDIASVYCFDVFNGAGRESNPSALIAPGLVVNGQRHTSVVCVRKAGVKAYIDGRLVTSLQTNFGNLSIEPAWSLPARNAIGVAMHTSAGIFHSIKVKNVTGTGRVLEAAAAEKNGKDGF